MLEQKLIEFREKTKELIDILQREDFDNLNEIISQRQEIIDSIKAINYSMEEFIKLSIALNLSELDDQLNKLMNAKIEKTRTELKSIKNNRQVAQYYDLERTDSILINKKI
ncbi:hypothetical protein ABG79_02212 [Caloramator mitchellensis]|uniref:Flagellar protein FliT n=1 Tax=Caloramator mitchellensis TaxID=908809 RepID=A0A0R3JR91_CALMK|nr:flagellar protein FliT [Caloramator mitchellensis]KRQ85984.1 hypothetical protein ABG79_02212 [Caloramator mitchellensis]